MKKRTTNNILKTIITLTLGISPILVVAQNVTVYKSPTCGCCTAWVKYLQDNDFQVEMFDIQDLGPIKDKYRVTSKLESCHTALVDGYVVEGHVPVDDIRHLLDEKPDIKGLTAPGMPAQSPGMASLTPKNYDVLSFDNNGKIEVFSRH